MFFPLKTSHIILASASETRAKILKDAGIFPRLFPVKCHEEMLKKEYLAQKYSLKEISVFLAKAKAKKADELLQKESNDFHKMQIIIGADQILECQGKLYNKPKTMAEAEKQLWEMRGKEQFLHTAFCLIEAGKEIWTYAESPRLKMRNFSKEILHAFLDFEGENLLSCVGACRIEGPGIQLFDFIDGAKETILGLPLFPLLSQLRERNFLSV